MRNIKAEIESIIDRAERKANSPKVFHSDMEGSAYISRSYSDMTEAEGKLATEMMDLEQHIMDEVEEIGPAINSAEDALVDTIASMFKVAAMLRKLKRSRTTRWARKIDEDREAYSAADTRTDGCKCTKARFTEYPSFLKDNEAVKTAIREYTLTINKLEEGDE